LTRYTAPHLTPLTLLATLVSSLVSILPSPTKFQPSPKLATTIPDSFLVSTTACAIATSIVHSKLDYYNSLYYNLPKSQITRLQQIQNSVARAVKAPKPCHITPILRCLHWLKMTERTKYKLLSLTKFSQPPNLHICITSSLFNLLAALALQLSLPLLDQQHHPRYVQRIRLVW